MANQSICPRCGRPQRAMARFCSICGSPLSQPDLGTGMISPNTVLSGRYIVTCKVGQGGMAAVYQAMDQRIPGRVCAVKEMSVALLTDPMERDRAVRAFQREASILARLDHPNLPRVYDFFEENGRHYLVMDFIQGQTLEDLITQRGRRPFPEDQALGWTLQLCDVLGYLHGQSPPVIFRDLKPSNIMLTPEGQIKLIDFGIARHFKPGQAQDTHIFGTRGYAPPEQYGRGQTDARSDVYSLGVLLHELLTGYDPTTASGSLPPARQLNPALSPNVEDVIRQATSPRPEDRFQSMAAFKQALLQEPGLIPSQPALSISPSALDLGKARVGELASGTLHVSGAGTWQGTVQTDQPWLHAYPSAFRGPSATIQVEADAGVLKPGRRYTGTVQVSSPLGTQAVAVSLYIGGGMQALPILAALFALTLALGALWKFGVFDGEKVPITISPTVATATQTAEAIAEAATSTLPIRPPTSTVAPRETDTPTGKPNTPTHTDTHVPSATHTRTPLPTRSHTFTPIPPTAPPTTDPHFRADRIVLRPGECTVLRWDVEGVRAVYLDGGGQLGHGSLQVCPKSTQTFTLKVVERDGREINHRLTIEVSGTPVAYEFAIEYKGCVGGISREIGQVKGQVLDSSGRPIAGAVLEITVEGQTNIVPPSTSDAEGWYGWNLTPNQRVRFVSLKLGGRTMRFTPEDYEVRTMAGCFHHVNFRRR